MKEFLEYIVKNLVDFPDQVDVQYTHNEQAVTIDLRVDSSDVGKVIGRNGSVIQSIRTIAAIIAARFGCQVRINLLE
jgi:hypothetical protein